MKKTIRLLSMLLCALLVLCACTPTPPAEENTTPVATDPEGNPPATSQTIDGIWYSEEYQTVIDLRDLQAPVYYRLRIGFYQYDNKQGATSTFVDNVLTLTFDDGVSLSWTFDPTRGTLTFNSEESDGATYEKVESLPDEYQEWLFPDFAGMDCATLVTLGSVSGLTYPTDAQAMVKKELYDSYYETYPKETPPTLTDRTVAELGDYVCVDYKGFLNGVAFQGGEAAGATILVQPNSGYIPGFAEGIAGHTVGSTFDVEVTFPENYGQASLAGQKAIFTMTLHSIYDMTLPDGKIAEFTGNQYTTYAELLSASVAQYVQENLWDQLVKASSCPDMPATAYQHFYQYFVEVYHYYAYYYGVPYENLLAMYGITDSALLAQGKSIALSYMVAYAVVATNGLQVSDTVLEETIDRFVSDVMGNGDYTEEEARELVEKNDMLSVHAEATYTTALRWLSEQFSVTPEG